MAEFVGLTRQVSAFTGADGKPGRKTLDVRWEEILAADGDPHSEEGAHDRHVGAAADEARSDAEKAADQQGSRNLIGIWVRKYEEGRIRRRCSDR